MENLAGAIYSMLRKYSPVKRTRRISNSGWFRFPNAKSFEIHIKENVPELQDIGIEKRFTPVLKFQPLHNKRMNRYLEYNISRLRKLKHDPVKYFNIVHILMKNSNTFRAAAISQIWPTWYKDLPLYFVINVSRKATRIIKNWDDNLKYHRVYIPKSSSDKWRPLGVPTPEWRLVLHMWNNFLHLYLEDYFLPSQHGCLPGRGTLTAWKEFFQKKLWKRKYIYEIDLRKFFDSVYINSIEEVLLNEKVPKRVTYYLMNLCMCLPKLPKEHKLDESKITSQQKDREALSSGSAVPSSSKMLDSYKEFVLANGQELADQLMLEDGCSTPEEWVQLQWALLDSFKPAKVEGHLEGTPQGASISPILSMTLLKDFLSQEDSTSYVDDAFFSSNSPFEIKDDPTKGIFLNQHKSGWVKYKGKWRKPLKFLGLEFDGKHFYASTRKGSRLLFAGNVKSALRQIDKRIKDLELFATGISENHDVTTSWDSVFKSKYIGWVQSRLYAGDWNPEIIQDFELKFGNGSWGTLRGDKIHARLTLSNTSSYASKSLVNLLRYNKGMKHLRRSEAMKFTTGKETVREVKRSKSES